jgi:secondary thiamine-phosphate synthase enzyme
VQIIKARSHEREELVEITVEIRRLVHASGVSDGACLLYVEHTTAGLTINENADPDVRHDMLSALRKLIPQHSQGFRHAEENSDAHIKTSLMGSSVVVPFHNGQLILGRWQGIFLCEFDGPRERKIIVQLLQ